jgi:hypothetical protein
MEGVLSSCLAPILLRVADLVWQWVSLLFGTQRVFDRYDRDKSGEVDMQEFKGMMSVSLFF